MTALCLRIVRWPANDPGRGSWHKNIIETRVLRPATVIVSGPTSGPIPPPERKRQKVETNYAVIYEPVLRWRFEAQCSADRSFGLAVLPPAGVQKWHSATTLHISNVKLRLGQSKGGGDGGRIGSGQKIARHISSPTSALVVRYNYGGNVYGQWTVQG